VRPAIRGRAVGIVSSKIRDTMKTRGRVEAPSALEYGMA
jgi:hypothetical protein